MKTVFALDCSVRNITLAIIQEGTVLASYNGIPPHSQSEDLMTICDQVLKQAKLSLDQITDVLFCQGPGSFTSLRIGVSTLLGLFWGKSVSSYVTSSLLFRCLSQEHSDQGEIVSVIRMGRDRAAVGILKQNSFHEDVKTGEELTKFDLQQKLDVTAPQAFCKIWQEQMCQQVTLQHMKINYVLEPDIG